ncbi:N-acetyltransferase domain-containing protein [Camponotus japonicus]
MKICEEWFRAGWYAAYIVLYVCAHPVRDQSNEMYISSSRLLNPESDGYGFEKEVSKATKLFEIHEDSREKFEENNPSRATRAKGKLVLLPLMIEPEAEMLPRGYKGVKPPGVTHMEFAHVKPQTDTSVRESATLRTFVINDDENSSKFGGFGRDEDAHYAASKYEEQVARNDRGSERIVVLEVDLKDDLKQNSKKTEEDTEAFGAEKSHFENENRPKSRKEKDVKKQKKQNIYKAENDRQETRNAAGHRNVYHKNGFEKDLDFYNNGRQSGDFEKHDRYGEKHAIAEDMYAKDKSNSSRLVEIEAKEGGKFEKTRAD